LAASGIPRYFGKILEIVFAGAKKRKNSASGTPPAEQNHLVFPQNLNESNILGQQS
jgi:hypothetical protein